MAAGDEATTARRERQDPPARADDSDSLVVRLNAPEELFSVAVPDMFSANGRLISGMEELIQELAPRRLSRGLHATIVLPAEEMSSDTEQRLRGAIDRYCQLRIRQTEAAARERGRETFAALGVGLVLFVVGIGLSSYIGQSDLPGLVKSFLADGLFLVIAWVGLWYPLDELVHYRRPLNRERKVLRAIREMEIAVRGEQRAHDEPGP